MASKKEEWAALGLCRWCGAEPEIAPDGRKLRYCKLHRQYFAKYSASYRAEHGIGKKRRCSVCRTVGCHMGKHKD